VRFSAHRPLNKFRNLLRVEWAPVYHVKGWGKFNRHYGDFCTGADKLASKALRPTMWLASRVPCTSVAIGAAEGFAGRVGGLAV
jgi:hypothetical protein